MGSLNRDSCCIDLLRLDEQQRLLPQKTHLFSSLTARRVAHTTQASADCCIVSASPLLSTSANRPKLSFSPCVFCSSDRYPLSSAFRALHQNLRRGRPPRELVGRSCESNTRPSDCMSDRDELRFGSEVHCDRIGYQRSRVSSLRAASSHHVIRQAPIRAWHSCLISFESQFQ